MLKFKLLLCAVLLFCGTALAKSNIPLSNFNHMPMVMQPTLSPNGEQIAVITNREGVTQVTLVPFDNPSELSVLLELGGEKYRIEEIDWVNDERLIVSVSQPFKMFKNRYRTNHIYSISTDGKSVFELTKRGNQQQTKLEFYYSRPHLLSLLPKDPKHILVTVNDARDNNYSSVFKVNVDTGEFEKYLANGDKIVGWHVNRLGEVLMAVGTDDDYNTDISYYYTRKSENDKWRLVKKVEAFADERFFPRLYEPETNSIIIESDHELNKMALWRYHIDTGDYDLLGEAPDNYDIDGPIWQRDGDNYTIVGYRYTDHFSKRVYFDQASQKTSQQIANLFAKRGLQAGIYSRDEAKNRMILSTLSDNKAPTFYTYDKKKAQISPWYGQYPGLNKANLPKVTPFEFKARDGMLLNGYITVPEGVKNPPLVLFPHGGPYGVRDYQYFDPFVQAFASRGYAVLQVNYRGSGGFGNSYQTVGYGEWGKTMQTDLIDAVNWVKDQKLADTGNACIAGASYGGYAALAAGYQTPKLFKCIVSIAGIGDMGALVSLEKRRGTSKSFLSKAIKNVNENMEPISPAYHATKFEAPVLLIHGKADTRVSYRQSEQMYDALKKAGKDVEIELFKFGTHHLDDVSNRKEAMELMVEFLDSHLK